MATREDVLEAGLLERFGNDLWIERRLNLDQVFEYIQSESKAGNASQVDWLRFFRFLEAECSGASFDTDKQWGSLLNLMEISRKLNHRRFRVRDIIYNKLAIESNANSIKLLNKTAKIARTVDNLLGDLKSLTKICRLELPQAIGSDATNRQDDSFIMREISSAKFYLQERCLPLVYTLRLEMASEELRAGNASFEVWQSELDKQDDFIAKVIRFLDLLFDFQSKLLQLKPLMNVNRSDGRPSESQINGLNDSLANCKTRFNLVGNFYEKIINLLHSLALSNQSAIKRANLVRQESHISLPLCRLFNPKNELIRADILDKGLQEAVEESEDIRRSMDDIMRNLRCEFGRFYFVNDFELLTIIALDTELVSESGASHRQLISKLFNNSIDRFLIDKNKQYVIGVLSPNGEFIELKNDERVPLKKKVNVYSVEIVRILNETIRKLRKILASKLIESSRNPQFKDSIDWSLPVQLMNLAEYLKFTQKVEHNLSETDKQKCPLDNPIGFYKERLTELSKIPERENSLLEFKHSVALSMTIHFISALLLLKKNEVRDKSDWTWTKQIRYYLNEGSEKIEVHIADARFDYRFDYLPIQVTNSSHSQDGRGQATFKRIISTQMSERCFLVASQAVRNFRLGANPFGPAGSGKTETIKALGNFLGCQVIVHNCDETNDSESIDRLIWGLAHTGLWGCFDEFNRLSSTTLSSVSGTLELVQTCIREGKTNVELPDGNLMCVDPNSAFFITLNPGDTTKYRGRRQLPANIRNLFLPISMTRVEIGSIVAESLLDLSKTLFRSATQLDEFMDDSIELARKFSSWLGSIKSTLHSNRCEWDLRQVMAIIRRLRIMSTEVCSDSLEKRLVGSIVLEVSPRLSQQELPSFEESLRQNFGHDWERAATTGEDKLINELSKLCRSESSLPVEQFANLHYQLQTRTGVILLGPSSSGKSRAWKLLLKAYGHSSIQWLAVNPRSCHKSSLFGFVDPLTRKWIDGLLTKRVREALALLHENKNLDQVWIVLDGPIDPDWVECLNSVLDDNQVLTLSSGERLDFCLASNRSIKLIFETNHIDFASPATISRLGLVYFSGSGPSKLKENIPTRIDAEELAGKFLVDAQSNLLIVTGKAPAIRLKFTRDLLKQEQVVAYTCNKMSDCSHLEELFRSKFNHSGGQQYLVLDNADSIEPDEKWQFKSFFELMRFALTYGHYYTSPPNSELVKTRTKFVLLMDSVESLDERTLSLASLLHLDDLPVNTDKIDGQATDDETLVQLLEAPKKDASIFMISNIECPPSELEAQISSLCSDSKFHRFSNQTMSEESLLELENAINPQTGSGGRLTFILRSMECQLLSESTKSRLLHAVNLLKLSKRTLDKPKFFYMSDKILSDEDDSRFWRSVSDRQCRLDGLSDANIYHKLVSLNDSGESKLSENQIKWLADKAEVCLTGRGADLGDQPKPIDACLTAMMSSISKARSDLESRKSRLWMGLQKLGKFEQSVEKMRTICKDKGEKLMMKKAEIEQLMLDIDVSLKNSESQRVQSSELKKSKEDKAKDIRVKSEQIEEELSKALQSVESSKAEIRAHLKLEALNEVKALRSPPELVKDVLDVLLMLLAGAEMDRSWPSIKSYLAKHSLRDELTHYDFKKKLDATLLSKVMKQMKTKPASFDEKQASRASQAVLPILGWIRATLEYGKALVMTQPLNEEMNRLKVELDGLDVESKKIESDLADIDDAIRGDTLKLNKLRDDYDVAQKSSESVQVQLGKAERVRAEVDGQLNKWRRELASIDTAQSNGSDSIIKYCSISSCLALVGGAGGDTSSDAALQDYMHLFELAGNPTKADFVGEMFEILMGEKLFFKAEETDQLLQLMILKICLEFQPFVVPFLSVSLTECVRDDELREWLSLKAILCSERDVSLVRCSDNSGEWVQSVELAMRLNKLVAIYVGSNEELDLDLMDVISRRRAANNSTVILMGQAERHARIRHLLRPMKLWKRQSTEEQTTFAIMNYIIERCDPELSKSWDFLESQLRDKQKAAKRLESNLLSRLAGSESAACEGFDEPATGSPESSLREDLVEILSHVQEASKQLSGDMKELESKMNALLGKQNSYSEFARKAAQFYQKFLADLGEKDKFYQMPLRRYMELLLPSARESGTILANHYMTNAKEDVATNTDRLPTIDYERIVELAELPMQPKDRFHFRERVKNQQVVVVGRNESASVDVNIARASSARNSQLKRTIFSLLETNSFGKSAVLETGERGFAKLMVILHDSAKSSPQFELDELFNERQKRPDENWICSYSKIYATGNQQNLGQTFERLILGAQSGNPKPINAFRQENKQVMRCVCVANAHLSARFINAHLLRMLQLADPTMKLLVILVAESSSSTSDSLCEFDSLVLDLAQVKYWHDELGLELSGRFELLERSCLASSDLKSIDWLPFAAGAREKAVRELGRQLILFHVVCQELVKLGGLAARETNKAIALAWKANYSFDYEQLRLAFKTALRGLPESEPATEISDPLRGIICQHLDGIIYGARMETLEDEAVLGRLMGRFLGSSESARRQLAKLDRRLQASGEGELASKNNNQGSQLLVELVGHW